VNYWEGVICPFCTPITAIKNQRRSLMNEEELFGHHDCSKCDRQGNCPIEGVLEYAREHQEEIKKLEEFIEEYVIASAQQFIQGLLMCRDSEQAKEIIVQEIVSNIMIGYVRAKIEEGTELPPIPEIWRKMDEEDN
jgi:hypothetical protein